MAAESGPTDVSIRFGTVDRTLLGLDAWPPPSKVHVWQAEGEFCLSQCQAGSFLVRDGREVVVDPRPGVDDRVLRLYVLGAVLGVLLQQRGFLTLHASVVALDGEGVAFCGASGAGKSTLARALYGSAHPIVTDDIAAVRSDGTRLVVVPGFPQLKLWPDSAHSLGDDPERLGRLDPASEKRARRVTDLFQEQAVPLRCVYVLEDGPEPGIEAFPRREAFVALIRHTFAPYPLTNADARAAHFRLCAAIAATVPVRRLLRPRDLLHLRRLAGMIEVDARQPPAEE